MITRQIIFWSQNHSNAGSTNNRDVVHNKLMKLKRMDEIIPLLNSIQDWCQKRNELVHALLNKNIGNQKEKLALLNKDGHKHCRQLDNFVKTFKKGNTIQKQFNIQ